MALDLLSAPKELMIDVKFSKYSDIMELINLDRENLLCFGTKWSTISLTSCKNIEEFNDLNTTIISNIKCYNIDADEAIDICNSLNILIGTSVLIGYYKSEPLIFSYDNSEDNKLMGSFNSIQLQNLVDSILISVKIPRTDETKKGYIIDMTNVL